MNKMIELARVVDGNPYYHTLGLDNTASIGKTGAVGAVLSTEARNNKKVFYQYDGNGNVVGLLDESFNIYNKFSYSPFGENIKSNCPFFGFSTKTSDASKLHYYGFRFRSGEYGCWLNRDPILEKGGYNLYNFAINNPISNIDRYGLESYNFDYAGLYGDSFDGVLSVNCDTQNTDFEVTNLTEFSGTVVVGDLAMVDAELFSVLMFEYDIDPDEVVDIDLSYRYVINKDYSECPCSKTQYQKMTVTAAVYRDVTVSYFTETIQESEDSITMASPIICPCKEE